MGTELPLCIPPPVAAAALGLCKGKAQVCEMVQLLDPSSVGHTLGGCVIHSTLDKKKSLKGQKFQED